MVQPAPPSLKPNSPGEKPSATPKAPGEPLKSAPGSTWPGGPTGGGPRKRKIAWPWIIFAVILIGLVVYAVIPHGGGQAGPGGRGGGAGGRGGGGNAPVSVNIAKVARADVPIYLNALGTVTPTATVTVRPQIAGQITKIAFQEGQMVKQGQFLVEIDPRPAQAALAQAQGVLARDQANLKNAQVLLQRYQTLLQQDSIARQDVDNQEATVRQLDATIKTDQAAVGTAQLNLNYTHIVAPVAGRVGLRQVDIGNFVTVGQGATAGGTAATTGAGLVVITQVAPIDVLFTLPEDNLPQVTARLRSGASLDATAFDRAQSTQLAQGKLLTLDNLVDTTTGTVKAKARFSNADGALFPNQFVNVRVLVDTVHNAVTVPSSAVLRGSQGLIVYVVKPDHTVTVRTVVPGQVSGQITAINSGLAIGETVVTDGTDRLREGSRVILPGECPPAGFGGQGGRRGGRNGQGGQRGQGGGQGGQGGFQRGQGGAGGPGCRPGQPGAGGGAPAGGVGATVGFGGQPPATGATAQTAAAAGGAVASTATQGSAPEGDRQAGGNPEANAGGGGRGGRGGGGMRLFDQLNLSPDQKSKIDAIMTEARQKVQNVDDPDARRQAMQGANQRAQALLTPDQRAKFQQLREQMRAQFGGGQGGGGNGGQD